MRPLAVTCCCVVVLAGSLPAQDQPAEYVTVKGMVIDSLFRALPGALVSLASARVFRYTNDSGHFTIEDVLPGVDTLQVRAHGYAARDFRLGIPTTTHGTIDIGGIVMEPGPVPTLTLTGSVIDTLLDRPVRDAEVMVNDSIVARIGEDGTFSAVGVPVDWGVNMVLVRRVGYAPMLRTVWIGDPENRRSIYGAMQKQAVDLPAVVVEGDRVLFSYGRMREFWRRRQSGFGRYLTRDDIEKRNPMFVSDMFRMIPGVTIQRTGFSSQVLFRRFGGRCRPGVWVDGIRQSEPDVDLFIQPQDVEAIEVYRGAAQTPAEFSGTFDTCGAIVIWTR